MTIADPILAPMDKNLDTAPEIRWIAARFAHAIAHPDDADDQGRTLESKLDVSSNVDRLPSRQWRLHARRCKTSLMLIHPHGESTDPTTAALVAKLAETHDEHRSKEIMRIAMTILEAIANVVVHAQIAETGRIVTRNIRLRLPTPWAPMHVTDQDGYRLLSPDAISRLRSVTPIMFDAAHSDVIGPGHRSRSLTVTARPSILMTIPEPKADAMEMMRVAAAAPIVPDDVIPTNPQGSLLA